MQNARQGSKAERCKTQEYKMQKRKDAMARSIDALEHSCILASDG
jgi:hypothetical protein